MAVLKDKIAVFQNGARRCFENDGVVFPVFAYAHGKDIRVVATTFSGAGDKDAFAEFMVDVIREHGVTEYLTVTEAWLTTLGHDGPRRDEAVVIVYCTPTSELIAMARIDRSTDCPSLGEWECSERKVTAMGLFDSDCRFMGLFARAAGSN